MNRTAILEQIQKNVERLSAPDLPEYKYIPLHQKPSPSVATLHEIMRLLRTVIFPGFFGTEQEAQLGSIQYYTGVYLEKIYDLLQEQIYNGLCFEVERCCDSKDRASEISIAFINRIPHIKYLLSTDVKAILDGDPAAKSVSEIIFCYPAVYALLHQRVAHELFELGVPVLPRHTRKPGSTFIPGRRSENISVSIMERVLSWDKPPLSETMSAFIKV